MVYTVAVVGLGKIGMLYDYQLLIGNYVLSHTRAFSTYPSFSLIAAVDPLESTSPSAAPTRARIANFPWNPLT
jgi:hypothetical protein